MPAAVKYSEAGRNKYSKYFKVDGTGTAAILSGGTQATLTDNGTGDYTLTFTPAFTSITCVNASPIAAAAVQYRLVDADTTKSKVRIVWEDNSGTATDTVFYLEVVGEKDAG